MLHLYALSDHPARLPAVRGIEASQLASATIGAIDAVYSEVDGGSREPDETAILAHAHVVEELAKLNDAVLPGRLARPYESETTLLEAIRTRSAELTAALGRVRGCVEMGVRVVRQENGKDAGAMSGGDYMRGRLETVRLADAVADELDGAVDGLTRAAIRGVTATGDLVLTAAYLLPKDDAGRFRAAVEAVARRRPELEYVRVGPWPPYSFALVDGGQRES